MDNRKQLEHHILSNTMTAEIDSIMETVNPAWFKFDGEREIFLTAKQMHVENTPVDHLTLYNALPERLRDIFLEIMDVPYSTLEINGIIANLKQAWILDRIKTETLKMETALAEDPSGYKETLSAYQDTLFRLDTDQEEKTETPRETILSLMKELEEIKIGKQLGFSWGLPDLDYCTGGIILGRLYVIGGLKKTGKTLFLLFVLKKLLEDGQSVFFASLEERRKAVWKHLLCSQFTVDSMKFYRKEFVTERLLQLNEAILTMGHLQLTVDDSSSPTTSTLYAKIRKAARRGDKIIALDFIQRTRGDMAIKKHEQMEEMATMLANAARDYGLAIIILSQAQSDVERTGKPTLGNLKDAQAIAENADHVLFLNDPDRHETQIYNPSEGKHKELDLHVWQREGISAVKIKLFAQLQFGHFACMENKRENDND